MPGFRGVSSSASLPRYSTVPAPPTSTRSQSPAGKALKTIDLGSERDAGIHHRHQQHGTRTARRTPRSRGVLKPDSRREAGMRGDRQPVPNGWVGDRRRPAHSDWVACRAHRRDSVRPLRQSDPARRATTAHKRAASRLSDYPIAVVPHNWIEPISDLRVKTGSETQRVGMRAFVSETAWRRGPLAASRACRVQPGAAVPGGGDSPGKARCAPNARKNTPRTGTCK